MEFKVKLQQLRINMKLSQEDLAKQLNVARQSVTKWENGQSFPDIQNLIQLSEIFKVSIDRLVKEEDECTSSLFKEESYSKENIRLFLIRAKNSCYVTDDNIIVSSRPNLPDSDFVINPYIGCTHACKYCYACFMKRFTNHKENWGTFIDVKQCDKKISVRRIKKKAIFLASVTDCYNPYEKKYKVTQGILEQLKNVDCSVTISTKSSLILRDIELLKQFQNLKVAISINTLDKQFQKDMDYASSISERLSALKELYNQGIYTVLFMSPIFPFITDFKEIIAETSNYVYEYWFENLNLRAGYKQSILSYITEHYPQFIEEYKEIYNHKKLDYWMYLSNDIEHFCKENNIKYKNYFYHNLLVAAKRKKDIG